MGGCPLRFRGQRCPACARSRARNVHRTLPDTRTRSSARECCANSCPIFPEPPPHRPSLPIQPLLPAHTQQTSARLREFPTQLRLHPQIKVVYSCALQHVSCHHITTPTPQPTPTP